MKRRRPKKSMDDVKIIIALVVTTVWAISFLMDIILDEYSPNPGIHGVMLVVAGALFSTNLIRGDKE